MTEELERILKKIRISLSKKKSKAIPVTGRGYL
jgi:hypothetical protein